jgi:hypothetical protein
VLTVGVSCCTRTTACVPAHAVTEQQVVQTYAAWTSGLQGQASSPGGTHTYGKETAQKAAGVPAGRLLASTKRPGRRRNDAAACVAAAVTPVTPGEEKLVDGR